MTARAERGRPPAPGHQTMVLALPMVFTATLASLATLPFLRSFERMVPTLLGAALMLGLWGASLFFSARSEGRSLVFEVDIKKQHWVQACTQIAIFLYWGWYVRTVYAFFLLILAQILFAFAVDALLCWSRRDTYRFGFGPVPIILSINLFLLFRPEWFQWQLALILVGFLAKEMIRWERDGRPHHIFNPSSFPLGVFALVLLATGSTDLTLGPFIAQSQFVPPHMYLFIFAVSIPVQLLFGVARMTMVAVLTMVTISYAHVAVTGTYLFHDAFISLPVFLGMHLLFTDPSTSPRSEAGQYLWGMLYPVGITVCYFILDGAGLPTFYEKLLPVPFMNLMVRRIDAIAASAALERLDPARIAPALGRMQRNFAYTGAWVAVFGLFSAVEVFGDDHPGQYYPYWRDACAAGSERACTYRSFLTYNYCSRGSGWACNEYGIYLAERRFAEQSSQILGRGCELGFQPACTNASGTEPSGRMVHADPTVDDLPIVLRGSKGPVSETDPERLVAMACAQGWPLCGEG